MKPPFSTIVKSETELYVAASALYGMGYTVGRESETLKLFMDKWPELRQLIVHHTGPQGFGGNFTPNNTYSTELPLAEFLIEAAKLSRPESPSWKIGCRTVSVEDGGLLIEEDNITIPKKTVEEMLAAIK